MFVASLGSERKAWPNEITNTARMSPQNMETLQRCLHGVVKNANDLQTFGHSLVINSRNIFQLDSMLRHRSQ